MTVLRVDANRRLLLTPQGAVPCLLGRGGVCLPGAKREGDGCTPLGAWSIRGALLRPGRAVPAGALPWRWIAGDDGWSDDPADPAYNRPVRHPHPFSAERLWREDGAYDIVLVLGWNDRPAVPGIGSAIFLHCTGTAAATEGCVAVPAAIVATVLPLLDRDSQLLITPSV